jgi:hypothetical protein
VAGSAERISDGEPFRWLRYQFMDEPCEAPSSAPSSGTTHPEWLRPNDCTHGLIGLRQADVFLRAHDTSLEAATRADLEASMADLLARRAPSTAATHHKVLKLLSCRYQRRRPRRASSAASQRRPTRSSVRMRLTDQPCSTYRRCR